MPNNSHSATQLAVSLFDFSATILEPWAQAGFFCISVCDIDAGVDLGPNHEHLTVDIMTLPDDWAAGAYIAFAAPPCTHLSASGQHHFVRGRKHYQEQLDAIALLDKTKRLCSAANIWVIENPVGIIPRIWRPADYTFDPADYAALSPADNYTKKTCLWTSKNFKMPPPRRLAEPPDKNRILGIGATHSKGLSRSLTPRGFPLAVFQSNKPSN